MTLDIKVERNIILIWFGKVLKFVMNYIRTIVEIADFVKDVIYAYTMEHASFGITLLLWTFSLFAMI